MPHLGAKADRLKAGGLNPVMENHDVEVPIGALLPRSDAQREMRSLALTLMQHANANHTLLLLQQHSSVSIPLLVVVAWLR